MMSLDKRIIIKLMNNFQKARDKSIKVTPNAIIAISFGPPNKIKIVMCMLN